MKVLIHIIWGMEPGFVGGTERLVLELAKGFKERGEEVAIVCSNTQKEIEIEGIKILGSIPEAYTSKLAKYGYANEHFFKNEIIGESFTVDSIKRFSEYVSDQLKDFDSDVYLLNSFMYSTFLKKTLPLNKMIITNIETPEELANYWGEGAFEVLKKAVISKEATLRYTGFQVTPSEYYAKFYSKTLKLSVDSLLLGINSNNFSKYKINTQLRKRYCSKNEILILLPARFDIKQKGHDIALYALSNIKKNGYKFKVIFTGYDKDAYGKNKPILDKLLKETNLVDNVILTKFDSILDAFSVCDFVISPERFTSYGLAISESLALGITTIVTPTPTYQEITSGYAHAHVMKDFSPNALSDTITYVLKKGSRNNSKEGERFRRNNDFKRCIDGYYIKCKSLLLKGIIFDMDGVIVNSEYHWEHVEFDFLKKLMPRWNKTHHKEIIGLSVTDLYRHLKTKHNLKISAKKFFNEYDKMAEEIYSKKVILSPNIKKVFDKSKQSKLSLGICSSSPRAWINIVISRFKLNKYFKYSLSAQEIKGNSKPAPDIYLRVLHDIKLDRDSCIVVEDSKNGVLSAKNAKLYCVGYRNGYNDSQNLDSADAIITDFDELLKGKLKIFRK